MSYEELLSKRMIEPATVTDEEIAEHLRVARHDIRVGREIAGIDFD
ncbi:MAG: hypothetical protein IBX64_04720 [Actinobacteria bacterium]|nr:hypothetical protein [Actinomycetota bacterium]